MGQLPSLLWLVGDVSRICMANFRGNFAQKIHGLSVLHAELMALILVMELAHISIIIFGWKVTH
jgi:hypothetical protein